MKSVARRSHSISRSSPKAPAQKTTAQSVNRINATRRQVAPAAGEVSALGEASSGGTASSVIGLIVVQDSSSRGNLGCAFRGSTRTAMSQNPLRGFRRLELDVGLDEGFDDLALGQGRPLDEAIDETAQDLDLLRRVGLRRRPEQDFGQAEATLLA